MNESYAEVSKGFVIIFMQKRMILVKDKFTCSVRTHFFITRIRGVPQQVCHEYADSPDNQLVVLQDLL